MKNKKNLLLLSTVILIFFIGFFTSNKRGGKSEKLAFSREEKIWLENHKRIKIPLLIPDEGSAYLYRTPEGDTIGVYNDYVRWLDIKYGLKLEFSNYNAEQIDSGEAVLAFNLTKTREREKNYTYLQLEAKTSEVLVKKSVRDFSRENLLVKKIGMVENASEANDYFYNYFPYNYRKFLLSSYKEGIEKLEKGEIDLLLAKSQNLMYIDTEIFSLEKFSDLNYNLAVNKNYPELRSILEKTLAVFHESYFKESLVKYTGIYNTQMLKDNPILPEVRKKYSKITVELLEGKNYLPLYYVKNNKFYGYIPTLLENISTSTGIPIEIVNSSSAQKKHIRAVDNDRNSTLSIPYYNWDVAVAGKNGAKYIKNYSDLIGKRVSYASSKYIRNFQTKEDINFLPYPDLERAIRALEKGEVDYVMGDFIFLDSEIENLYLSNDIKVLGFLEKSRYSLAFTFEKEDILLYKLFSQLFPKDVSEYSQLKELLVSPKLIKINYYQLGSLSAFFLSIIGVILLFLKVNIDHRNRAEKLNRDMISSFEMAASFNDEDTGHHIVRVTEYSELLAKEMGLSSHIVRDIGRYASLHDIGKIGIPSTILKKPGKLDPEELAEMRKHPDIGHRLVKNAGLPKTAENLVRFHHERWDGKGYPMGLRGKLIPIEARIVSVADVYDALRQKRSYKAPFTHEETVQIIASESGVLFDPELVKAFMKLNRSFDEIFSKH